MKTNFHKKDFAFELALIRRAMITPEMAYCFTSDVFIHINFDLPWISLSPEPSFFERELYGLTMKYNRFSLTNIAFDENKFKVVSGLLCRVLNYNEFLE